MAKTMGWVLAYFVEVHCNNIKCWPWCTGCRHPLVRHRMSAQPGCHLALWSPALWYSPDKRRLASLTRYSWCFMIPSASSGKPIRSGGLVPRSTVSPCSIKISRNLLTAISWSTFILHKWPMSNNFCCAHVLFIYSLLAETYGMAVEILISSGIQPQKRSQTRGRG
jgi:hypothetical protein